MATYIKNREIYLTNLKQTTEEPWKLTSCFYEDEEVTDFDLMYYTYHISEVVLFSEDGNRVFFLDKTVKDSGSTLYYRDTNKPETASDAVKIDTGVTHYTVNKAGNIVTYYKKNGKLLYQYDVKRDAKEKIADLVEGYVVSDDGRILGYSNEEKSIYLKRNGQESEKIADGVTDIEHISSDFKTFYYRRGDILYKHVEGKKREKIATDISRVIRIDDSGKMYYCKNQKDAPSLMDYIEDDLQASDAKMQEPIKPTVPSDHGIAYDEWVVLYEQYLEDYEAYVEAYNAYQEKLNRDALREELSADTESITLSSLYFFDGKKENLITDTYIDFLDCANDAFVLSYNMLNKSDYVPVSFSAIKDKDRASDLIREAWRDATETYVTIENKANMDIQYDVFNVVINDAGTLMYYLTEQLTTGKGDLYQVYINKKGIFGTPTLYDEELYSNYYTFLEFVGKDELMYFKDLDTYTGTLYVNGTKIAEDVYYFSVEYIEDTDEWFYITNYDSETQCGTLKRYRGGEVSRIADDVHCEYQIYPGGQVLYLCDYSMQTCKGELCEWYRNENRTIDHNVIGILPAIDVYGEANYDWFISDWWWA